MRGCPPLLRDPDAAAEAAGGVEAGVAPGDSIAPEGEEDALFADPELFSGEYMTSFFV